MNIRVNNQEKTLEDSTSVLQLATELQLPVQGVAIAVNNRMIPRIEWENIHLNENDNVVIIKAACGG